MELLLQSRWAHTAGQGGRRGSLGSAAAAWGELTPQTRGEGPGLPRTAQLAHECHFRGAQSPCLALELLFCASLPSPPCPRALLGYLVSEPDCFCPHHLCVGFISVFSCPRLLIFLELLAQSKALCSASSVARAAPRMRQEPEILSRVGKGATTSPWPRALLLLGSTRKVG